jgi:hypothetical protein
MTDIVNKLLSRDNWIIFSRLLLRELNSDEAILLSYLINISDRMANDKGWFYRKMQHIRSEMYISESKQTRIMRSLAKKGCISTKYKGIPARRFIRINSKRIREIIDTDSLKLTSQESSRLTSQESTELTSDIITSNKVTKRKGNPLVSFGILCARILKKAIHANTRVVATFQIKRQAKEFESMLKVLNDEDRILNVLEWYCAHMKDREKLRLPSIVSPKQFRKQFVWIEERYVKLKHQEEKIKITEQAERIADRLSMKSWPKGCKDQLPRVVQVSLNEYNKFMDRLQGYNFDDKMQPCVDYLVNKLPNATHYIQQWFEEVNEGLHRLNGKWGGDLHSFRFTPQHKKFENYGRGLVDHYSGGGSYKWQLIMEELYAS